ncbi:DUF885 domain-containing protein [Nonomuraea sp. NPDC050536]|uniref:DUF885 domain-containing protein n=1 Tax=Nonomuraea sp. NPDC050536 TaxID=3364366 RepID=UPI0037CB83BF
MNADLEALAERYFARTMAASPFTATVMGVPGYDAGVPDLSEEYGGAHAADLTAMAEAARAIDLAGLDEEERITRAMLIQQCATGIAEIEARLVEHTVSGPLAPHEAVLGGISKVVLDTPQRAADYATRCQGLARYLGQAAERLRAGVDAGRTPPRRLVEQGMAQLTAYLATPVADDPLLHPVTAGREEIERIVGSEVRAAVQQLWDVMAEAVRPRARPDERSGLVHLPGGDETYRRAVLAHTTTDLDPERIHELGLGLCEQLREEHGKLGSAVFGTGDLETVFGRLRDDPGLRYPREEDIVADARHALRRAEEAAPGWFGTIPNTPCAIEPMNALEAPDAVLGYYHPPAADGSRPGRHWINTFRPESRTRYEYEALAFHESVPGHHLQISRAQELTSLPAFRRFGNVSAYCEGWGLYAERLADEMGLYSGDLARFGMLSFDSWRACRLVVDTGIHALGWSRDRAIAFMRANTPLTEANIVTEVDRYIAWPGQALAYMIGRLEIVRIREAAQRDLGARFDIRGFHDMLLGSGAVPLGVLSEMAGGWVSAHDAR